MFVESDMHYYRTYVKVFNRPDQEENIGYILHCKNCGHRKTSLEQKKNVNYVIQKLVLQVHYGLEKLFDKEFVQNMLL